MIVSDVFTVDDLSNRKWSDGPIEWHKTNLAFLKRLACVLHGASHDDAIQGDCAMLGNLR